MPKESGLVSDALILLSGGLDSSACTHFYISKKYQVNTLFIDYGQPTARKEREAAVSVSTFYGTSHRELIISGADKKKLRIIRGRNALLPFCALSELRTNTSAISLGIHAGTDYPDCSSGFLIAMQNLFNLYCDGRVIVTAPFVDWSKRDILQYCQKNRVPVDLTYSCQTSDTTPCGTCDSCLDRKMLYAL